MSMFKTKSTQSQKEKTLTKSYVEESVKERPIRLIGFSPIVSYAKAIYFLRLMGEPATMLLFGPQGTAKTTFFKQFAKVNGLKMHRVQGRKDMLPADILSDYVVTEEGRIKKVIFIEDLFANRNKYPPIFYFDEVDKVPPQVLNSLLELYEEQKYCEATGKCHPLKFVGFLGANTKLYDDSANNLPRSFTDRITITKKINVPGGQKLKEIIKAVVEQITGAILPVKSDVEPKDLKMNLSPEYIEEVRRRYHAYLIKLSTSKLADFIAELVDYLNADATIRSKGFITPRSVIDFMRITAMLLALGEDLHLVDLAEIFADIVAGKLGPDEIYDDVRQKILDTFLKRLVDRGIDASQNVKDMLKTATTPKPQAKAPASQEKKKEMPFKFTPKATIKSGGDGGKQPKNLVEYLYELLERLKNGDLTAIKPLVEIIKEHPELRRKYKNEIQEAIKIIKMLKEEGGG